MILAAEVYFFQDELFIAFCSVLDVALGKNLAFADVTMTLVKMKFL